VPGFIAVPDLALLVAAMAAGGLLRRLPSHMAESARERGGTAVTLGALGIAVWSLVVFPGWLAWASAALGWTLLALAEIDRRHLVLPDALVLPLIPAGLAVIWASVPERLPDAVLGAVLGYASLAALAWLYERLRGREGLGLGDAKLFAAAGAWTTWAGLPSVLLLAGVAGLAFALLTRARGGSLRGEDALPLGTFMAPAIWLVWSFGPVGFGPA